MADPARILVIDDEPGLQGFLRPALRGAGYGVMQAATVAAGLRLVTQERPDLVLLDLGLPDMDGQAAIPLLLALSAAPIIILSAREQIEAKVAALDAGADDYVEKPFAVVELLARIRAALRRAAAPADAAAPMLLRVGPIEIDFDARLARTEGAALRLTPREWDVLAALARMRGRVVTRTRLLTAVWGAGHAEDLQYLRVHVASIRRKLGAAAPLLRTEPGIGYRLGDPE